MLAGPPSLAFGPQALLSLRRGRQYRESRGIMTTSGQQAERVETSTRIGGLTIKGELHASEDLTIEGTFEGTIDVSGHRLITGADSRVRATVSAAAVTIRGHLEGHIAADAVDIGRDARVDASVMTKHLALEEGARFNGAVNTERARAAGEVAKRKAAPSAVASS
jgi:cytoskeletal protein CcmA (bactofilin family)